MKLLRLALLTLVAFPVVRTMGQTPRITADKIDVEMAKVNLQHFESYLSECAEQEVRCLWFDAGNMRVGRAMTIDLQKISVYTARDVFDHAVQASHTRPLSDYQVVSVRELLPVLPASLPNVAFADGLHIAFWHDKKLHTRRYSRVKVPLIVQRLYDIGGGYINCTYAN
ncbi:MAG: hypothetical protein KDK97_11400 [Verrucomicrobiales bacterium]|nr:hypothetical protein [Verrucomicrobiales bacterium]MCP5560641.1 hypothetical protein [Verrucomicrobiaceae bacterium]